MPEPDYQGYAASFNPVAGMMAAQKQLAEGQQIAAAPVAGTQLANGDYAGAARTLFGSGNIAGGQQVTQYGAAQAGASALAANDFPAAKAAFGTAGDVANVQATKQAQGQNYQQLGAYLKNALPVLQQAYQQNGPDGLNHAVGEIGSELQGAGFMSSAQLAGVMQQAQQDPEGFLRNTANFVTQLNYQKVGDNSLLGTDAFGRPLAMVNGQTQATLSSPSGQQSFAVVPGSIAPVGPSGGTAQPPPAQQAAPGAAPAGVQGATPAAFAPNIAKFESANGTLTGNGGGTFQIEPQEQAAFVKANPQFATVDPTSPQYQQAAYSWLTSSNANDIANAGFNPATPGATYAAWALGSPAAIALAKAGPGANAAQVVGAMPGGSTIVSGNPGLFAGNATTADILNRAASIESTGALPAAQPAQGAQPTPSGPPGTSFIQPPAGAPAFRDATPQEAAAHGFLTGQIGADGQFHGLAKQGDVDAWTPQAIDAAARQMRLTGQPPLALMTAARGAGAEDAMAKIQNQARALDVAAGISPAQRAVLQSNYQAANTSNQQLIPLYSKMTAYEQNVLKDINVVKGLVPQGTAATGIKTTNDLENFIREEGGDPALSKYKIALKDLIFQLQ